MIWECNTRCAMVDGGYDSNLFTQIYFLSAWFCAKMTSTDSFIE